MATPKDWGSGFSVGASAFAQRQQHVTGLDDGRILVTWVEQGSGEGASTTTIKHQILNTDGTASKTPLVANAGQTEGGSIIDATGAADFLAVTALSGGGYVIAWSYVPEEAAAANVYFRVFDAEGVPVSDVTQANSLTANTCANPDLVPTLDGGFVIAWDAAGTVTEEAGIYYRELDAQGISTDPEVLVSFPGGFDPALAYNPENGGSLYVAYADHTSKELTSKGLFVSGTAIGDAYRLDRGRNATAEGGVRNDRPDIAVLGNDAVAAVYVDGGLGEVPNHSVYFSIDGGRPTKVNTSEVTGVVDVNIVALPNGGFVVVWTDGGSAAAGTGHDVLAQMFTAAGERDGDDFVLTDTAENDFLIETVEASSLGDGRVLVTWDVTQDSSSQPKVLAQIIDTRTEGVSIEGGATNQQYAGTSARDQFKGGSGDEFFHGFGGSDTLHGGAGDDIIIGAVGADVLRGGSGKDVVSGGSGKDTIIGGKGVDKLSGGTGADRFQFDARSHAGDVITFFSTADFIVLEGSAFGLGTFNGRLAKSRLDIGRDNASDKASEILIFRTTDDTLWFDSNGSATGGTRIMIADFGNDFGLTQSDILII
jgi:Ca2+-binding RTX toxin-like protein